MILLAFQFYIHVAPAGSLTCKLENTTDEKGKTTLKECITFLKDKNINPDTEISDNWKYSDDLKERCFYKLVIGKLEKSKELIERIKEAEQELEKEDTLMEKIKKQELEQEPTRQPTKKDPSYQRLKMLIGRQEYKSSSPFYKSRHLDFFSLTFLE
jgi:hypothetical protein